LGTDGFGRSDTKKALRRHFEVDAECIVFNTLSALADDGQFDRDRLPEVIDQLEIDPRKIDPATA
jgi:pyruvate dehydrogenase E1 component